MTNRDDDQFEEIPHPSSTVKSAEYHGCGCQEIEFQDGHKEYEPCLACALHQAGSMLQAAAKKLREKEDKDS